MTNNLQNVNIHNIYILIEIQIGTYCDIVRNFICGVAKTPYYIYYNRY